MPLDKDSKRSQLAKHKDRRFRKIISGHGLNKSPAKSPPDTTRIPWLPTTSKTGTDD